MFFLSIKTDSDDFIINNNNDNYNCFNIIIMLMFN
jgi:hypothetical protein